MDEKYKNNIEKLTRSSNRSRNLIKIEEKKRYKKNIEKISIIAIVIGLLLIGLLNINMCVSYYFGLAFLLGGFFVTLIDDPFVLIFLFSHGLTGLGIIVIPVLSSIFKSPVISDISVNFVSYIIIACIFLLIGFISAILYNLSYRVKCINNIKILPFLLLFIGILIIYIIPWIYGINIEGIF